MLFDCLRVNTGLGFHWICNSEEKKVGGICALMMILMDSRKKSALEYFWHGDCKWTDTWYKLKTRTWVNYVLFFFDFFKTFRRVCEDLFYHESYGDESVIMILYRFLNIQMFSDVSSRVGLCPYMGNWYVYALIWFPPSFLGFCVE